MLHGTGGMAHRGGGSAVAALGVLAVGVDLRHHGERVADGTDPNPYWRALKAAWRRPAAAEGAELSHHTEAAAAAHLYPFLYDSVYDCSRVLDYLETRADADCSRVGAFGNSLGGMIIPLLAAADSRLTACAPCIGVQGFAYALDHECWHARVGSLQPLFDAVADDRGAPLDGAAVRAAWEKLVPGLLDAYDAPRALAAACLDADVFVVNSAADPRCPRPGVEAAVDAARAALRGWGADERRSPPLGRERGGGAAPAAEWKAGHVITDAMFEQVERFLSDRLTEPAPDP